MKIPTSKPSTTKSRKYKIALLALVIFVWLFSLSAERTARLLIVIFPNSSWTHRRLADVYMNRLIYIASDIEHNPEYKLWLDQAIREYQTAVLLAPNSAKAHYMFGYACSGSDESPVSRLALKEYKAAVSLEPNNITYLFELAQTFREYGKKEEALKLYKKAISLRPVDENDENLIDLAKDIIPTIITEG